MVPSITTNAPEIALTAPMMDVNISGDNMIEITPLFLLCLVFCILGGSFIGAALGYLIGKWLGWLPHQDKDHERSRP